ncbi:cytochrome P450 [Krasilnikovia sp. MM14-A1259]|uniref:cytochrome P450 n=1 Tax=Krasilnikovia sp. MM14-A1259 TaxID=3373539 RepID=UPI0038226188
MTTLGEAVTAYPFPAQCPFQLPPELGRLRREAPVSPVRLANGASAYLVTSYRHVRMVLTDERFSRRPVRARAAGEQASARKPGAAAFDFGLSIADPADHARWRRHTGQVFHLRQAEGLRTGIGRLVDDLLDDMAAAPGPVDLMDRFAFALPLNVLGMLFDVPEDLRPGFDAWAQAMRAGGASMAAFGTAMAGLHEAAVALVRRRRAEPGPDPLSHLIRIAAGDGSGLSDDDLVSTVLLLTVAGYETVATQLGNGLLALFQHPAELDRVRSGEVAVDAAVEEILRYAQASTGFAGMMYATTDVPLDDVVVPAGAAVFVSMDSAGRDELRLPDPERFDVSRGAASHHLTFGAGAHFCLGAPLARVELQEGLSRLLARFDLTLVPAAHDVTITGNRFHRLPAELPVLLVNRES